jgi:hypothetical protein
VDSLLKGAAHDTVKPYRALLRGSRLLLLPGGSLPAVLLTNPSSARDAEF